MVEVESKLNPFDMKVEQDPYMVSEEAKKRAAGYMKLKKSQCQGHSEHSDREEDDFSG